MQIKYLFFLVIVNRMCHFQNLLKFENESYKTYWQRYFDMYKIFYYYFSLSFTLFFFFSFLQIQKFMFVITILLLTTIHILKPCQLTF